MLLVKICAAILRRLGFGADRVIAHKEWAGQKQGKWDPGLLDMARASGLTRHRDAMFGQLGDDLMQGDGMIDAACQALPAFATAPPGGRGQLWVGRGE